MNKLPRVKFLTSWLSQEWKGEYASTAIKKSKFRNLPMAMEWNNLVRAFDLRYWYLVNGKVREKGEQYVYEIENLHKELNYQHIIRKFFFVIKNRIVW